MPREHMTERAPVPREHPSKDADADFTLIEGMVILGVITTFVLVAWPTYRTLVAETGRSEAYAALLDLATRQESFFNAYRSYTDVVVAPNGCEGAGCGLAAQNVSGSGSYWLTASPGRTNDLATSYVVTATVKEDGPQQHDEDCAVLTINWLGEMKPVECW